MDNKFKRKLTWEDIEVQCGLIGDFFKQIPDELKAGAAEYLIYEIVNWGSHDHFQALGIFQEAMLRYRKISLEILDEDENEYEDKNEFVDEDELTGEEKEARKIRIEEQLIALEKTLFSKCPKCNSEDIEFCHSKWNCNNCNYKWKLEDK